MLPFVTLPGFYRKRKNAGQGRRRSPESGRSRTRGGATGLCRCAGDGRKGPRAPIAFAEGVDGPHRTAAPGRKGLHYPHDRGPYLCVRAGRAARAGGSSSGAAHRRLGLQRIGRGGAGGDGRLEDGRSQAAAHAPRQDGAEIGTDMMLELLVDAALRSIVLGAVAGLGLMLARTRNPQVQMTAWTVVLLISLAMPALTPWMKVTIPTYEHPARLVKITWTNVAEAGGPSEKASKVPAQAAAREPL